MNKEEIYDNEINPLMSKIIKICKDNKIAMACQFAIPNNEDDELLCTTVLTTDEFNPPKNLLEVVKVMYHKSSISAFTITTNK